MGSGEKAGAESREARFFFCRNLLNLLFLYVKLLSRIFPKYGNFIEHGEEVGRI